MKSIKNLPLITRANAAMVTSFIFPIGNRLTLSSYALVTMRKINVIVFEDRIHAVLTSLGEAAIAQIIDLRERTERWPEVLAPYVFSMTREKEEKSEEPEVVASHELSEGEKQIMQAEEKLARTARTVYFEAWVPDEHVKQAVDLINKSALGQCVVTDQLPAEGEKAPILLKPVPSFLAAFERLVYAFGYPSSGDINPVIILAFTFPILFGIMFADVGQGLLFVAIGILLTLAKRKVRMDKVGDIIKYLFIGSEMFILLGISATFFGFVFGEFFGPSGLIHPISLGQIGPFRIGGFEPTQEPMEMLRFAILVGALHLALGLILRFVNEIRHRHYRLAPVPIFWLWLLFGGLEMWASYGGISNISKWFSVGIFMMMALIMLPLTLILVFTGLAEGFTEGVGFSVEVFAETLSHTMSYGRLMALGLIHSAMNYLFLVLGGVEHGNFPLGSIPIIAVGTMLVLIIEGLVVFVHTLRLHWVEWFSKFHSGEGIAFKPFQLTK